MNHRFLVFCLLSSLLAAPLGAASWGAKGSLEPDTTHDVEDRWMHLDPDATTDLERRQVYFNGWAGTVVSAVAASVSTSFNPNFATVGSAVQSYPYRAYAMLGYWKDCNEDGYVGLGDNGLFEYSALLPYNADICPSSNADPRRADFLPVHNDGQWIHEFISIGYDDVRTAFNENPWNVNDTGARVWADWNLPESAIDQTCAVNPQPHGTYRSTGGFLRWSDCIVAFTLTSTISDVAHASGQDDLAFDDAPKDRPDQSGSTLNQRNPWGEEGDATMVSAFDCNGTPIQVADTTGQGGSISFTFPGEDEPTEIEYADDEGYIVNGRAPNVGSPGLNPDGTPAGTVNQTEEYAFPGVYGDCDRGDGNTSAEAPYTLEGANEPTSASGRTSTDHTFLYNEGNRAPSTNSFVFGRGYPDDGQAGARTTSSQGLWVGNTITTVSRNPYTNREQLGPEEVTFVTYYAFVSPGVIDAFSLDLPKPDVYAEYGAEACRLDPSPFVCDATQWWRNAAGEDIVPRDPALGQGEDGRNVPVGVYVGQPYNLRDIDCYDTSARPLADLGVHHGVFTNTDCGRP